MFSLNAWIQLDELKGASHEQLPYDLLVLQKNATMITFLLNL